VLQEQGGSGDGRPGEERPGGRLVRRAAEDQDLAPGLRGHLARSAVLVRDTANFGLPDGVRIAVPDAEGLERFARALTGYR